MKKYKYSKYFLLIAIFSVTLVCEAQTQIKFPIKELGNCKNQSACKQYCSVPVNYLACTNFGAKFKILSKEATDRNLNLILKQMSPQVQGCAKSFMNNMMERVNAGDLKGANDIPTMAKDCLPKGVKIPVGGGLNMEMLNKMQEFYGNSLPAKDQEALKKLQGQLKGVIPQGTPLPKSPLNLDDIKKAQQKMQEELDKIPPETLKYIKEQQKQQEKNETLPPPEIQGRGQGGGMGL